MNIKEKYLLILNDMNNGHKSEGKVNEVPNGYG